MSLRMFRKLDFLRNLKGLLGAYLMRVRLISVFKLVYQLKVLIYDFSL